MGEHMDRWVCRLEYWVKNIEYEMKQYQCDRCLGNDTDENSQQTLFLDFESREVK